MAPFLEWNSFSLTRASVLLPLPHQCCLSVGHGKPFFFFFFFSLSPQPYSWNRMHESEHVCLNSKSKVFFFFLNYLLTRRSSKHFKGSASVPLKVCLKMSRSRAPSRLYFNTNTHKPNRIVVDLFTFCVLCLFLQLYLQSHPSPHLWLTTVWTTTWRYKMLNGTGETSQGRRSMRNWGTLQMVRFWCGTPLQKCTETTLWLWGKCLVLCFLKLTVYPFVVSDLLV